MLITAQMTGDILNQISSTVTAQLLLNITAQFQEAMELLESATDHSEAVQLRHSIASIDNSHSNDLLSKSSLLGAMITSLQSSVGQLNTSLYGVCSPLEEAEELNSFMAVFAGDINDSIARVHSTIAMTNMTALTAKSALSNSSPNLTALTALVGNGGTLVSEADLLDSGVMMVTSALDTSYPRVASALAHSITHQSVADGICRCVILTTQ